MRKTAVGLFLLGISGLVSPFSSFSQADSVHHIRVHFLYGSKPAKGHKGTEMKYFGGLHGGHVSIELDSVDYGFVPNDRLHIFPHKRDRHSAFVSSPTHGAPVYPQDNKVVVITIPITQEQYLQIKEILVAYDRDTPYDYAFFGMRCAAATEDILGQIGVITCKSKFRNVCSAFYPKKLRKRLIRLAGQKGWKVETQDGRDSRKWERD